MSNIHAKKVLRFEFSDAIIERLTAFANVHQYDDRKTYKEAWTAWLAHDEIAALVSAEIARLKCLGYNGDVVDKLFKSGRYYFRGKTQPQTPNQTQPPTKTRAKYVTVSRSLLDAMDEHIERGVRSNDAYTPAIGFSDFWNAHAHTVDDAHMKAEIARLVERYVTSAAIHEKLKKTYKNRYFMMMKSASTSS